MKNISVTIAILVLLLFSTSVVCQNWKRIYSYPYRNSWAFSVTEAYDNGYLLLSNFLKNGDNLHTGWLIKTDVNGNKLWERFIGDWEGYGLVCENFVETSDKGINLAGTWTKTPFSNSYDPLFLKLDVCGNLEWCRYFKTDDHGDFGINIMEVPDGYIGLMAYYGYDYATQRIALTKLDLAGNVEWVQTYHSDSAYNEEGRSIMLRSDGDIMVTGEASVVKPGYEFQQPRPLFIITAPDGTLKDFGVLDDSDTLASATWQTREKPDSIFYSTGSVCLPPAYFRVYPYFLKTNGNNEIIESRLLADTASVADGMTQYLNFLSDTTLIMTYGANFIDPSAAEWGLYKLDTSGNKLKTRILMQGSIYNVISGLATTQDHKILACAPERQGDTTRSVLFKLNSDLEDDSIYSIPYVYDWACEGGVDTVLTIDPECGVYVDIDELERLPDIPEIKVFPNPVSDVLTVSLPEYLVTRSAQHNMQASVYIKDYQKDSRLDLYDINGDLVVRQTLIPGQLEAIFNASVLSPGLYLIRLVYQNRQVSTEKFVKE
ncbi:MAG: T9SS type A sorting domain-containing protein [Bacteroidales bacterium]|jgi:hypothetical protein|nr:T9SS type A sorting domain-containing protein [Bacteroidales bacterium]